LLRRIRHPQSQSACLAVLVPALQQRLAAGESPASLQSLLESQPLRQLTRLGGKTVATLVEQRVPPASLEACRAIHRRLTRFYAPRLSRGELDLGLSEVWQDPEWIDPTGGPVGGAWNQPESRRQIVREVRGRGTAQRGLLTRGWRGLQRWVPRLVLLCGLLWGSLAACLAWSTPARNEGKLVGLRQSIAQIPAERRMWPLLREWWLKVHEQPRFEAEVPVRKWVTSLASMGARDASLSPELVEELQQSAPAVELLLQASRRVELGYDPDNHPPLPNLRSLVQLVQYAPVDNSPASRQLDEVLSLLVQAHWELEFQQAVAEQESQFSRSLELLVARLRLQQLHYSEVNLPRNWWLIARIQQRLLQDLSLATLRLQEDEVPMEGALVTALERALLELERCMELAECEGWPGERTDYLDTLYSRGPVGLVTAEGLRDLSSTGSLDPLLSVVPEMEWGGPDQALRWLIWKFKSPLVAAYVASRGAVDEADRQLMRVAATLAVSKGMARATAVSQLLNDRLSSGRWSRVRWAPLLLLNQARVWHERQTVHPWQSGVRRFLVQLAARRYRQRTGAWPQQISDLVPRELPSIPTLPGHGTPVDLDWAEALPHRSSNRVQPTPTPMPLPEPTAP